MSRNSIMKGTAAAMLVVAGLSWPAQAEMLALRCEGTKTAIPGKAEPDDLLTKFKGVEDEPDILGGPKKELVSTDVIVTDQIVYAFDKEFETGFINDALIGFLRSDKNPRISTFALESFTGRINRIAGTLEATQLKYKKSGWLYLEVEYSLNCRKMERKF
jgi:hypothetical protein